MLKEEESAVKYAIGKVRSVSKGLGGDILPQPRPQVLQWFKLWIPWLSNWAFHITILNITILSQRAKATVD